MRSSKEIFSKKHNTSSRSQFIDYNYLDKLSEQDREWLARFTENYYSASFDKNPAFVRTKDLIPLLQNEIIKLQGSKKLKKFQEHLDRALLHNKKFYQVSENEKKYLNIDLRKLRSLSIFYKIGNNRYSTSKDYKYSENNIIDPTNSSERKACNDLNNTRSGCVMGKFGANCIDDYELELEVSGPEQYLIEKEEEDILLSLVDED